MEQNNLPNQNNSGSSLPILSILVIAANALWMLLFLFLAIAGGDLMRNYVPSGLAGIFVAIMLIAIILLGLKLWGGIKMYNKKKGGYILYLIPNILISLLFLISYISAPAAIFVNISSIIVFITWIGSIVFMFLLGKEMKKL